MDSQLVREIDELSLRTGVHPLHLYATIALSGSTRGRLLLLVDENGEQLPRPVAIDEEDAWPILT